MKSKPTRKPSAKSSRKQPYQRPAGGRDAGANAQTTTVQPPQASQQASSSSSTAFPASFHPSLALETIREAYEGFFQQFYPGLAPRDDFDLFILGERKREGTPAELFALVDAQVERDIKSCGSREAAMKRVQRVLESTVGVTGRKPRPGRDIVHTRAISDSKYSIRLWPGNAYVSEYCMDFVETATQKAVNSPFEFELWAVPDPDAPWLCMPSGRLHSLEHNFHMAQDKIPPGEEKWVLRDGQTCLLKRPGKKDILFRVPARRKPRPAQYEYEVLEFPKEV